MTKARRKKWLKRAELLFWVAGLILLGSYAWVYLDRTVYQSYEDWAFDRRVNREPAPLIGFVLHSIRFGGFGGAPERFSQDNAISIVPPVSEPAAPAPTAPDSGWSDHLLRTAGRGVIGRIEIPRLGVRAMVRDNTDSTTLRRAVGHIRGTALPGQPGNVGLAGHRDTFFAGLRDVRKNDTIELRTLQGPRVYSVEAIKVVPPSAVEVLRPTSEATLTLVTCYPFNYVGSAPQRFIVQAREIRSVRQSPPGL